MRPSRSLERRKRVRREEGQGRCNDETARARVVTVAAYRVLSSATETPPYPLRSLFLSFIPPASRRRQKERGTRRMRRTRVGVGLCASVGTSLNSPRSLAPTYAAPRERGCASSPQCYALRLLVLSPSRLVTSNTPARSPFATRLIREHLSHSPSLSLGICEAVPAAECVVHGARQHQWPRTSPRCARTAPHFLIQRCRHSCVAPSPPRPRSAPSLPLDTTFFPSSQAFALKVLTAAALWG